MGRRLLSLLGLILLVLLAIMVIRTVRIARPATTTAGDTTTGIAVDTLAAAQRLAGAVKFPTVSYASGGSIDTAAFIGLHQYLESEFPLVHATLTRELVGGLSLLYTWRGADSTLAPVVLMGHMDVVPVPEANLPQWVHAPFSGEIANGFVWGRGTLDDKTTVLAILEAAEGLLQTGFRPARTIYLTFGHDEEVSGRYGARAIVAKLVAQGVEPALVLDEGGFMAAGLMPGLTQRAAIVGIAEKGYLSLRLTAAAQGGHSSMPTGRTAIGALSRAIARLEAQQFPSSLQGPTRGMVEAMAPYLPFPRRLLVANLWLTAPLVQRSLAANPLGAALLHTTTAPTMLSAGIKDNVLPPDATAVVNFRILPGETSATVIERVRRVVADPQITVQPLDSVQVDPSPVSDISSPAYQLLRSTIQAMAPHEQLPVIPYLVMGGTDAKYWGAHSDRVFRFLPIPMGESDRERIHGLNERVALADYAASVGFFTRLMRGLNKL
ncbi:MAG TPA: M20 family peptidase [Gemmatimonadales bacterium]|nr:M20 family peptidase [Gemmatimonadales bacterium]